MSLHVATKTDHAHCRGSVKRKGTLKNVRLPPQLCAIPRTAMASPRGPALLRMDVAGLGLSYVMNTDEITIG